MRRTIWRLTIIPLVAFMIATLPTIHLYAAGVPMPLRMNAGMAVDDVALSKVIDNKVVDYKKVVDGEKSTLAFQIAVTSTVAATPTIPSIVLPRLTPLVTATAVVSPAPPLSSTPVLSDALEVTTTQGITLSRPVTLTPVITSAKVVSTEAEVLDAEYAGPIEGTIIANRTAASVRFFVEGATYELAPLRSIGLPLPRVTAVLNLFNCDAVLPETQEGCFWDPYLLNRDSFYEVTSGEAADLTLQTAGTPPGNQVWVQNRTGKREQIFYAGETYELPPSTVQEFILAANSPAIFYLRNCLEVTNRTVCEWSPNDAAPGFYYALVEITANGVVPNSRVNTLQLQSIIPSEGVSGEVDAPDMLQPVICQVQVPVLNVRSGPGLQYQIISKVQSSEQEPSTVVVIGRDSEGQWLAVEDRVADGGWITGSSGFVSCGDEISALPIAEVRDGRLAPTPIPSTPAAPVANSTTPNTSDSEEAVGVALPGETPAEDAAPTAVPTIAPQTAPPGQSLIVVHNGFDQQIRFTLDQRYRSEVGLSEYDLQPGQSISLLVYPGVIAFSASTPWRGISGNDDFVIEEQQTLDLWITFVPDPDGSGRWLLQF